MKIILAILVASSWIVLLSVKTKEPINLKEKFRNDIDKWNLNLTEEEKTDLMIQLENSLQYKLYELKQAYYELGQAIKNSFKK